MAGWLDASPPMAGDPQRADAPASRLRILLGALSCHESTGGAAISAMAVADLLGPHHQVSIVTGSNLTDRPAVHELTIGPMRAAIPLLVSLPTRFIGLQRQVEGILDRERPDLIHLQDANLVAPILPVARRRRIPVLVTMRDALFVPSMTLRRRDSLGNRLGSPWVRARNFLELVRAGEPLSWPLPLLLPALYAWPPRQRALLNQATLLLPVSHYLESEARRCGVTAPIEPLMLEPLPPWSQRPVMSSERVRFLFVGRIVSEKGVRVLLRAFRQVAAASREVELVIAGRGPQLPALRREAEGLPVTFVGFVPHGELAELYAKADIVVVPSLVAEASGRVPLEAGLIGRPTIAARSGGLAEVVGEIGMVVPPGDASALAEAMLALARDPERRAHLGALGRRRAEQQLAAPLTARLLATYRRVLGAHGGAA